MKKRVTKVIGQPKKIDVDFVVICDCHYDEETNTAKHALVATIK